MLWVELLKRIVRVHPPLFYMPVVQNPESNEVLKLESVLTGPSLVLCCPLPMLMIMCVRRCAAYGGPWSIKLCTQTRHVKFCSAGLCLCVCLSSLLCVSLSLCVSLCSCVCLCLCDFLPLLLLLHNVYLSAACLVVEAAERSKVQRSLLTELETLKKWIRSLELLAK